MDPPFSGWTFRPGTKRLNERTEKEKVAKNYGTMPTGLYEKNGHLTFMIGRFVCEPSISSFATIGIIVVRSRKIESNKKNLMKSVFKCVNLFLIVHVNADVIFDI